MSNESTNAKSWKYFVGWFDDISSKPHLRYVRPIFRLTQKLAASDRAALFRPGQSLTSLMISTAPYHGLKPSDPFVGANIDQVAGGEAKSFEVYYRGPGGNVEERWLCATEDESLVKANEALDLLWANTDEERKLTLLPPESIRDQENG